jgi:hypothetical protein
MFEDSRQEVNDAITLVGAEFPNVRIVDWSSIAAADAANILRGDGHHLTNDGRLVLASTVADVMGKAPTEPGKCLSTSFSNDSGASVNGTDDPPQRPVGGTPTTAKAPTATTKPPTNPVATTQPPATTVAQPPSPDSYGTSGDHASASQHHRAPDDTTTTGAHAHRSPPDGRPAGNLRARYARGCSDALQNARPNGIAGQ